MNVYLLSLVAVIYGYVTLEFFIKGSFGWGFVYLGYSMAGFALVYLTHKGVM